MELLRLIISRYIKEELEGQTVKEGANRKEESNMSLVKKREMTCFTSLSCPNEDSFLYCENCQMIYEGGCLTHGPLVYSDNAKVGQGEGCNQDANPLIKVADTEDRQVLIRAKVEQSGIAKPRRDDQMFSVCEMDAEICVADTSCVLQSNVEIKTQQEIYNIGRPFTWDVSGVRLNYHSCLNSHTKTHSGEKPYTCDAGFAKKEGLKEHTGEKPYKCNVCCIGFARSGSLKVHKRTHTGEKPYICDVCRTGFNTCSLVKRHMRTHTGEKPYMCELCGARFADGGYLKGHKRKHTGEKPYQCDVCGAGFALSGPLKSHKRTHTGEKPYKCDMCGARFAFNGQIKEHMRTHTGEKPYKCSLCDAGFALRGHLKSHKRTHTGEKPYKCDVCGAAFSLRGPLKTHKRIHTGEKPYICAMCGVGFAHSGSLKAHNRSHT